MYITIYIYKYTKVYTTVDRYTYMYIYNYIYIPVDTYTYIPI